MPNLRRVDKAKARISAPPHTNYIKKITLVISFVVLLVFGYFISKELRLLNEQQIIPEVPYEKTTWVKSDVVKMLSIKALENNIKPKYLIALANCESSLDPYVQSKYIQPYGREESFGLFQIHTRAHTDISIEEAKDPEFNTNWAINEIKKGNAPQQWVHCNKIANQYS